MIDNRDGIVTDEATGLLWQQKTPTKTMNWQNALTYCERLELGDHTDWRLPTITELLSLVDYSRYNPTVNTKYFPDTVSSYYWSSTTYAYNTYYAWGVYFHNGYDYSYYKNSSYYVRAVRKGGNNESR